MGEQPFTSKALTSAPQSITYKASKHHLQQEISMWRSVGCWPVSECTQCGLCLQRSAAPWGHPCPLDPCRLLPEQKHLRLWGLLSSTALALHSQALKKKMGGMKSLNLYKGEESIGGARTGRPQQRWPTVPLIGVAIIATHICADIVRGKFLCDVGNWTF